MGKTIFKIFIWGGISSYICSEIMFYGSDDASHFNKIFDRIKNSKLFFCVSLRYEMSGKLHLICMKTFAFPPENICLSIK